eukprot:CAMPEP_0119309752 /NCGR_PEP_ID=MMETSP1333-20130426/16451_1 /TAXON_ID=418940 /ORGANISM="Scyphosphaera apsteinii, Strain RCC1455" /LENGTH=67 /DNA_ID=CAMNT_0007313771 /DNA_START=838 /DNA_END=1038 /DNA_ORIENTATION=+
MTTGTMLFMILSGSATPNVEIPMPLLPVPYAAPMLEKTRAKAAPIKPQNGASKNGGAGTIVLRRAEW